MSVANQYLAPAAQHRQPSSFSIATQKSSGLSANSSTARSSNGSTSYAQRGIMASLAYLLASLVLLAAAAFGVFAASQHHFYIYVDYLSGKHINTNSFAILVGLLGNLIAYITARAVITMGRRWMFVKRHEPRKVTDWIILTGGKKFRSMWHGRRVYWGWCSLGVGLGLAIGPCFNGALIPSTGPVANELGWRYPTLVDNPGATIFDDPTQAAGQRGIDTNINQLFPTATLSGLYNGIWNRTVYSVLDYLPQQGSQYQAGAWNLSRIVLGIPRGVPDMTKVDFTAGCGPTLKATVTCVTNQGTNTWDSSTGTLSYTGLCDSGSVKVHQTDAGDGAWSQACLSSDQTSALIDYYIAGDPTAVGQPVTSINCRTDLSEDMRVTAYDTEARGFFFYGSCGDAAKASRTLPPRVTLALANAVAGGLVTTWNGGGISTVVVPLLYSIYGNDSPGGSVQESIQQGFLAAGQAAYAGLATNGADPANWTDSPTPLEINFQAYVWNVNPPKAYAACAGLTLAAIFLFSAAILAIKPHIRYDPSAWEQTLFIALGSSMTPPSGVSTGNVTKKHNDISLQYGEEPNGDRLGFVSQPTPADPTKLYD